MVVEQRVYKLKFDKEVDTVLLAISENFARLLTKTRLIIKYDSTCLFGLQRAVHGETGG